MSNFKGTKGKWKISNEDLCGLGVDTCNIKGTTGGESICTLWGEPSSVEQKANALLIVKAPEMLEMLDKCKSILGNVGEFELVMEIEHIIKSATEL